MEPEEFEGARARPRAHEAGRDLYGRGRLERGDLRRITEVRHGSDERQREGDRRRRGHGRDHGQRPQHLDGERHSTRGHVHAIRGVCDGWRRLGVGRRQRSCTHQRPSRFDRLRVPLRCRFRRERFEFAKPLRRGRISIDVGSRAVRACPQHPQFVLSGGINVVHRPASSHAVMTCTARPSHLSTSRPSRPFRPFRPREPNLPTSAQRCAEVSSVRRVLAVDTRRSHYAVTPMGLRSGCRGLRNPACIAQHATLWLG